MTPAHRPVDELAWAAQILADAGVESPRADARWLLAWVLDVEPGRLPLVDEVTEAQVDAFHDAVGRRAAREPVQHIIGVAPFGPLELAVGPGVFVPRPETEWLVEWATDRLAGRTRPMVVDLCSGSGALALAVATTVPTAEVAAVERASEALVWLRRNVAAVPAAVGERVAVHQADVTDVAAVTALLGSEVDLVVANPPYVPATVPVSPEVAADPADAVFAGSDGMSVIVPMARTIAAITSPGAYVGVEHDDTTADAVVDALAQADAFADIEPHHDLTGRPRFVTARRR
ncbi:peptide chain release factor N(5)-glutamine methyltransferase [Gordonia soli]|uniref:Release factor glutamine methyltransferase n=1 Tax=Gordonia soli NBRC 108243 TaxID=1223545 RepID=M0QQ36_9ACTN|nr:peptide chain release factor N(5)-glutamine methyltransferase [Gordonia soli]GAC70693.1 putative protein methyltransferase [Gordonia soli NBRC 108243]